MILRTRTAPLQGYKRSPSGNVNSVKLISTMLHKFSLILNLAKYFQTNSQPGRWRTLHETIIIGQETKRFLGIFQLLNGISARNNANKFSHRLPLRFSSRLRHPRATLPVCLAFRLVFRLCCSVETTRRRSFGRPRNSIITSSREARALFYSSN